MLKRSIADALFPTSATAVAHAEEQTARVRTSDRKSGRLAQNQMNDWGNSGSGMDEAKDGIRSTSGVYAIAAGLGLVCCGLPVLLAATAGGIVGFVGSAAGVGTLAAALITATGLLIYRDRKRNLGKKEGRAMTNVNQDKEVGDWDAIDDCCGTAEECCVPVSQQTQSSGKPERQSNEQAGAAADPVEAGRAKELPRPLQPAE